MEKSAPKKPPLSAKKRSQSGCAFLVVNSCRPDKKGNHQVEKKDGADELPSIFINAAPGKNATPHREYSRIIYMSEKWQFVLELWRAVCYDKGKSERGMQMNSQQRRQQLLVLLRQNSGPVSATAIAKKFGVSRQIIVGDVALLRAAGEQISATPRGYVLKQEQNLRTDHCLPPRRRAPAAGPVHRGG